jgi:hypothetical protein
MKIKVDAELYDALLWGAEILQAQITMEELAHEATRKAYMRLTAAHDTALLAATEMVLRPTVVKHDCTMQIEIDSLEERLLEATHEVLLATERWEYWGKKAMKDEDQTPIRKDMDAPGMY